MPNLMRVAAAAAILALARSAHATDVRTTAMGGVEGAVADEASEFSLFNAGNAAGLALLEKKNRVDYALGGDGTKTDDFDGEFTTFTVKSAATTLRSPGGAYEGVTYWITDQDVVRASLRGTNLKTTLGVEPDPEPPSTPPELDGVAPAPPEGDQEVTAKDLRIAVEYAHRFGDRFSVGVGVRPLSGSIVPKKQDKVKTDETKITMLDYQLALAAKLPLAGGSLNLGLNAHPYNDAPELAALAGSPAALASFGEMSEFGGLKVKRTFETESGAKQVTEMTPSGRVVGFQADWGGESPFSAKVGLDVTAATIKGRVDTDTTALGPPADSYSKVEEGDATDFRRVRWEFGTRYRFALSDTRSIRAGLALAGAQATTDTLDFPDTSTIVRTTESSPLRLEVGLAFATKGGLTVGAGYERTSDTQTETNPLDPSELTEETKPLGSRIKVGGEYWFTGEWAGRLGLVLAEDKVEDNDPDSPEPGTDPSNSISKATLIAFGAGYRGETLGGDVLVVVGSPTEDPGPEAPATRKMTVYKFAVAVKYTF